MKTSILFVAGSITLAFHCLHSFAAEGAALPAEIENPEVLHINTQPWHASLMPYGSSAEALAARRHDSSFARSLDGGWKFHWVETPSERPMDFYRPDYDDSGWKDLPVPSNWQLFGYGTPFYRNHGFTFKSDVPHVMSEPPTNYTAYKERNPVGSYRHTFEVPADWRGRRVYLSFDGVDSAFFLWINGKKVGYSTNSRNVAEFDITPYIQWGKPNLLAAEVYRYNAGSYIEDQDMWRLSGIFRNVTLWSAPTVQISDFTITTDFDPSYRDATLKLSARVRNQGSTAAGAQQVGVELYGKDGLPMPGVSATAAVPALAPGAETTAALTLDVPHPEKWSAETPNLYTAVIRLIEGGKTNELLSWKVGFRKVEIKGRVFMVNGVPVKLKGANRHENWPDTGHYVSEERMIEDIKLLKQANCNHVRTCHYSDDPRWYELCDEYGIYLVAEANVEGHGLRKELCDDPRYEKAIVDRNLANVENFKNSPSVVVWSLGNETHNGKNFKDACSAVKKADPTRPVHYEGFSRGDRTNPADIDSRMYGSVESSEEILKATDRAKPYYLCEYAHAMFNSMGALKLYNDLFDKYPAAMGGAIWEWEDQGLWNKRDPKRPFLAYGGGFGEVPNDGYYIHKGIVFSDRTPKPHFPEVKRVYQWIDFRPTDNIADGKITIRNKYAFIDLKEFRGRWALIEDGVPIQKGDLPALDLPPGQEKNLQLPINPFQPKPGAEYFLNVAVSLPTDRPWAKAGYEIANAQIAFPVTAVPPAEAQGRMKPLKLVDGPDGTKIQGSEFTLEFSRSTGLISAFESHGSNLLLPDGGPKLILWRAEHQIDDEYAAKDWRKVGLRDLTPEVQSFAATQLAPDRVQVDSVIRFTGKEGFLVTHTARYTVDGNGDVVVDNSIAPEGKRIYLARVGVRLILTPKLDRLTYLARGPMENYPDRKEGSDIGLYRSSIRDQLTPYAKPMECGNHEDARWVAISGSGLPTLLARSTRGPLQFSALPYTDEQLEDAPYSIDLPPSTATVLTLSGKTLGVGTFSCGPKPRDPYLVENVACSFSYALRLLNGDPPDLAAEARKPLPQPSADESK